ncbi:excinuclease ABC subunit UvrA [Williamwhitmania taraxaci]|uniref:UvrABC system protein A n=1 Tax=Williamwhitmania taraxaci TaxID=1640674 RepID=A0A1G6R3V9_9BACT|nr:excinuclease ABC subunit UvrA [Williamwhitmania taraxaci]SDC99093.1 excinuclease ABC subunit A [Williamwhitmania taraxaci]
MSTKKGAQYISIRGARVHNLKNVSINIPRNQLVVVTGLSGSGKSSLVFDTLYAEGQRRYVESLSSYARQFLGRITKPEVDAIEGIPPAIAIEQKVNTRNPRSTVGTSTEIYDYLKLLFARAGRTISPTTGKEVKRHSVTDVVDFISTFPLGTKVMVLAPYQSDDAAPTTDRLLTLLQNGITRIEACNEIFQVEEIISGSAKLPKTCTVNLVIDRFSVSDEVDFPGRCGDSVQTAFSESDGSCVVHTFDSNNKPTATLFANRFEENGVQFEEPSVHLFNFNSPLGACPKCEGYGKVIGIDEELVIPDRTLSLYEGAVAPWKTESMQAYRDQFIKQTAKIDFPIHRAYEHLNEAELNLLWNGTKGVDGINSFFEYLEEKKYKIQYRVMLSRYMGKTVCPVCKGSRLRPEANYVKVAGSNISELVLMPIDELQAFFKTVVLEPHEAKIAERILIEVRNRINFLMDVGLGYLTLNRLSATLSGGESQRINLATSLGSSLVGSLYILDEPSIGLHPRDTTLLINVLQNLKHLGNTVVVVEHDEEIMRAADQIIDVGPLAGQHGGEIIFQGKIDELQQAAPDSLTARYLIGTEQIPVPKFRRKSASFVEVKSARENNLKSIDVKFPLNTLTVVTGVSGSGKSTLVKGVLYPALSKLVNGYGEKAGKHGCVTGDLHRIKGVEMIDQNPIGKSTRSNPVTYVKAYEEVRKLYSDQPYAKANNFKPSHFSFNMEGGRCEECQGEGIIKVEMQFMADVTLVCEQCHGKRFKNEVLDVRYQGLSIFDVLELTVDQAIEFFGSQPGSTERKIAEKMKPLQDVGLGYVRLGQSSSTLSGGESQRVKLASFLGKENSGGPFLFIFDEPTTGLHFHDIRKLLDSFNALVENGHSLIVVEHNLEVIKCADYIIDLGPEGGKDGGQLVFSGTPEELLKCKESYTARYLKDKL